MSKNGNNQLEQDVKNIEGDIQKYDKMLDKHSERDTPHYLKGNALLKLGNITGDRAYYEQAVVSYSKAITLASQKGHYIIERSKVYALLGKVDEAANDIVEAQSLPSGGGIYEIYINSTAKDIMKLNGVWKGVQKLIAEDKIPKELEEVFSGIIEVVTGIGAQLSEQGERLNKDEKALRDLAEKLDQQNNKLAKIDEEKYPEMVAVVKVLHEELHKINERLTKLEQRQGKTEGEVKEIKTSTDQQQVKLEKQEQVLEISGTNAEAEIKGELEKLKSSSPELYVYCNSFIWTLQSYINAFFIADKGVLAVNTDSSTMESGARYGAGKLALIGSDIATRAAESAIKVTGVALGAVPFIGGIASMIVEGTNAAIDSAKLRKKENKIKVINDIISSNHKLPGDVELSIGLAALEIIKSENKKKQIDKPYEEKSSLVSNVVSAISDKFGQLKDKVLKNKELKSSPQADLAIQDALGLIAYMYTNYAEVKANKNGLEFYKQVSQIVLANGLESVIKSALQVGREMMAEVKAKIGAEEQDNIKDKAQKGLWKKEVPELRKRVSEYLEDKYLEECLGKNPLQAEVDALRMVVFKRICKGIKKVSTSDRNYECATKFADKYPELIKTMAQNYPELFVSKEVNKLVLIDDVSKNSVKRYFKSGIKPSKSSISSKVGKDDLEIVQVKLGAEELKKVKKKAKEGLWAKTKKSLGKEVEEYLEDKYLKDYLGSNPLPRELDAARMVIFKHICQAINAQNAKRSLDDELMTCAREFAKKYPDLVKTIAQDHPELFASKAIAEKIDEIKGDSKLLTNITQYFDSIKGKGLTEHDNESPYDSYWYEYTKGAIDEILKLRLESVSANSANSDNDNGGGGNDKEDNRKIKLVSPSYVWDGSISSTSKLCQEIMLELKSLSNGGSIIMPLNLYGKHWVGIAIDRGDIAPATMAEPMSTPMAMIKVRYMDSENNIMPLLLKTELQQALERLFINDKAVTVEEVAVGNQHYDNCGLETIENLVEHISGYRPDEDSVLAIHSMLMGDALTA